MVEVVNLVNQSIFSGVRLWIDNIKERYPPGKLEFGVIWGYVKMTKKPVGGTWKWQNTYMGLDWTDDSMDSY